MTTNFTFRDFIVYVLTGFVFMFSFVVIYIDELLRFNILCFNENRNDQSFSFLITICLIPLFYLLGHLVSSLNYLTLKYFLWLQKKSKTCNKNIIEKITFINEFFLYRHRVAYKIVKYCNSDKKDKAFSSVEEFWILCAKLQKANQYSYAEYWYVLNDLFKAVNMVFGISIVVAICNSCWLLAIIFMILTVFSYLRAVQYADFFILTVDRQSKVLEASERKCCCECFTGVVHRGSSCKKELVLASKFYSGNTLRTKFKEGNNFSG